MTTATRFTPMAASRGRCLAALAAGLLIGGTALGQNAIITATYQEANPKDAFTFKWKERGQHTKNVGVLRWDVPTNQFGTSGLDRAFDTYCAEALVPVNSGKTYRFEVQSPEVPEAYGFPNTDEGRKDAIRRTQFIRELYGKFYTATQKTTEPVAATAFQVALWELLQESSVPEEVANPFDLFAGNFQADYENLAAAPAHVQRAQEYVRSLTGNDNVFYENADLAGRELVRLKGLPNAAGEIAQSQLALRYVTGGVGGAGGAAGGATGGGGGGLLAGGGVGAGAPTSLAGGGGFGGLGGIGTNPGGTGTTTTVPPVSGTTPPTTVPNTPINPGTVVPPINQPPITPTNPNVPDVPGVPAPPALLLGLAGVALLAGRKVVGRKAAK